MVNVMQRTSEATDSQVTCNNHCGHSLDWMEYDEDLEQVVCTHPIGHACEYCGGLTCGHVCEKGDDAGN